MTTIRARGGSTRLPPLCRSVWGSAVWLLSCSLAVGSQPSIEVVLDSLPRPLLVSCSVLVRIADRRLGDNMQMSYRMGGKRVRHTADAAVTTDSTVLFIIPAAFATVRGVDFRIRTAAAAIDTTTGDIDIRFLVGRRRAPSLLMHDSWRLVSYPLLPADISLAGILHDDLGSPDPTQWRAFAWHTREHAYTELLDADTVEPGRAWWLRSRVSRSLLDIDSARTPPTSSSFAITLEPGWNAVGVPFAFAVDWQDIAVASAPHTNQIVGPYAWGDSGWENPLTNPALLPWEGYYVKNELPFDVTLAVPAVESASVPPALYKRRTSAGGTYRLCLTQGTRTVADDVFGVHPDTSIGHPEPPPGPHTASLHGWFSPPAGNGEVRLMTDIRGGESRSRRWEYHVDAGGDEPVTVRFDPYSGEQPLRMAVAITDSTTGASVDIGSTGQYTYMPLPGGGPRKLTITAGDSAVLARLLAPPRVSNTSFELRIARRTVTPIRIHYSMAERANPVEVRLEVYGPDGRLVRVPVHAPHAGGWYAVNWDGCDMRGNPVPAGAYVCSLRAAGRLAACATIPIVR